MAQFKTTLISLLPVLALSAQGAIAAPQKDQKNEKPVTIAEMVKDKESLDGFIKLYRDNKTGSLMMEISESQLNTPLIYFVYTHDAVPQTGSVRGIFRENRLIKFEKNFNKINIIAPNNNFYFNPDSPVSRAAGANISDAVLASLEIQAINSENNRFLVNIDDTFLQETLHKITPTADPDNKNKRAFKLGKLNKPRTQYVSLKNYPKNTDIIVKYVFENTAPLNSGGPEVTDARYISSVMQHSFIQLPDNDYQPRKDDPRVGYFATYRDDLTSYEWAPYHDYINRWHLEKQDPNALLAEPKEKIVWWIENTTPIEFRDTIKDAVLSWNQAFEKAGFKNVMEVKIQSDDATWDAGDLRYNVLRWTSSPKPRFGGYGPSLKNPVTGEIFAADIMLEQVYMKNRWFQRQLFATANGTLSQELDTIENNNILNCSLGYAMNLNILAGDILTAAKEGNDADQKKLIHQSLFYIVLHEVGHTLGLNHNMAASHFLPLEDIHNTSITQKNGLIASVMDYPPINIAPEGTPQGDYFTTKPGPYDVWAIEYGYSSALEGVVVEEQRLEKILQRSTEPQLLFANDADDMRQAGRHIDPRAMIGDLSQDPLGHAKQNFERINQRFTTLKQDMVQTGDNYHKLATAYAALVGFYNSYTKVVSRQVGGVHVDRAYEGQTGAQKPFTPVSRAEQLKAMELLSQYVFTPKLLSQAEHLYPYLQTQRRGFFGYNQDLSPNIAANALAIQKTALDHLLHGNVLNRMDNSELYGNSYSSNEMLKSLTKTLFNPRVDSRFQHNLQVEYVKRLINISSPKSAKKYNSNAQSLAVQNLQQIHSQVKDDWFSWLKDEKSVTHHAYLDHLISQGLRL